MTADQGQKFSLGLFFRLDERWISDQYLVLAQKPVHFLRRFAVSFQILVSVGDFENNRISDLRLGLDQGSRPQQFSLIQVKKKLTNVKS